jgi:hypothetical protein
MLRGSFGAEIDSFDCVIRVGTAHTSGYEKHVGRKTTVRVGKQVSSADNHNIYLIVLLKFVCVLSLCLCSPFVVQCELQHENPLWSFAQ